MARLVLVGLPGVGKSTIGRLVAEALGETFVDTDELFTLTYGETPAAVLRRDGDELFRAREFDVVETALGESGVVATGGGVVTTPPARALLQAHGHVVWLTADVHVLATRVAEGDRPLLGLEPTTALHELAERRAPWYAAVANETVSAEGPITDVVARVLAAVQG